MKLWTILFATISGIFIPLNSVNAFSKPEYYYGFSWGSVTAICTAYSINAISESDASMMLNSLVKAGNEMISDPKLKNSFNNLIKFDNGFKENGCSKFIK
tara:strand:+ start:706 stop:1005 length:300 start_codon:yes stop_codon:yes gene_type:complete